MALDAIQQAAREQFGRQSHQYGPGHVLENLEDVRAALPHLHLRRGAGVLDLVARAPASVRRLFRLGEEEGRVVWWWRRLTLVAERTSDPDARR